MAARTLHPVSKDTLPDYYDEDNLRYSQQFAEQLGDVQHRILNDRERPGFDQIAQGLSGIMSVTGQPGAGPMRVGCAVADVGGGLLAALGILTALLEREQSGEGQWVQSSLLQAAIQLLDFQAARYTMLGEVADQQGNDHPTSMPTSAYKTKDGYINIAVFGGEDHRVRVCVHVVREHRATRRCSGALAPVEDLQPRDAHDRCDGANSRYAGRR